MQLLVLRSKQQLFLLPALWLQCLQFYFQTQRTGCPTFQGPSQTTRDLVSEQNYLRGLGDLSGPGGWCSRNGYTWQIARALDKTVHHKIPRLTSRDDHLTSTYSSFFLFIHHYDMLFQGLSTSFFKYSHCKKCSHVFLLIQREIYGTSKPYFCYKGIFICKAIDVSVALHTGTDRKRDVSLFPPPPRSIQFSFIYAQ